MSLTRHPIPGVRPHWLTVLLLTCLWLPAVPAAERMVALGDDEVPVAVYAAEGKRLALWIPAEHGVLEAHHAAALALQQAGIESWIADPFSAWFLPVAASSLDDIPETMVGALIDAARAATGKDVYLVSHDRGAVIALYGARRWQLAQPGRAGLAGAVLVSPYLLEGTPEVGEEGRYLPIAAATNLPLYVVQPQRSPLYPRLPVLKQRLAMGGSSVFTQPLPALRDRYFFRPDALDGEREAASRLPALLRNAFALLATQSTEREAAPLAVTARPSLAATGERRLSAYRGDPAPPSLVLDALDGANRDVAEERGRVVLVNFWASWCPPCVHEMPSMQQLADRFADRPFTILAVNLAEAEADVRAFVDEHGLRFPVLLDPAGSAIEGWKVFAYPTSYVIDQQGRIRYALFGAIDWLEPDTVKRIEALLDE